MNRMRIVVGLLVVVVIAGGFGVAADSGLTLADPEPVSEADGVDEPFTFRVEAIEDCGETCREVTAAVENTQNDTADGVTVQTRIFAGENSTEERLWETSESVGTLAAGESYTSTDRVDLSLGEAYAIEQADGWITIETTIDSDDEHVTLRESRQVA